MKDNIRHVIVLMLENRSFDHMLGFLAHPQGKLKVLTGDESNRFSMDTAPVKVTNDATGVLALGPNHSHDAAMTQITGNIENKPPYNPDNSGFVLEYGNFLLNKKNIQGKGGAIMKCMDPMLKVPALATLALEYGVCTKWHCSVPGETWPNRNFAHAATSDGEVDIKTRFHRDETIFEILERAGQEWAIYHDGIAQAHVFPSLWMSGRRGKWGSMNDLESAIENDELAEYSFVEPRHLGKKSNSQHPGLNQESDRDFLAGEALIRRIYNALVAHENVWEKTLFLITYDENGGFFDREPPPQNEEFTGPKVSGSGFRFGLLGPRVPAVLVSAYIEKGTVDDATVYDHSSIFASVKERFAPGISPKSAEIRKGKTFWSLLSAQPRRLSEVLRQLPEPAKAMASRSARSGTVLLDESQQALLWVAGEVEKHLETRLSAGAASLLIDSAMRVAGSQRRSRGGMKAKPIAIETSEENLSVAQNRFMRLFRKNIPHRVALKRADQEAIHNPTIHEILSAARGLAKGETIQLMDSRKNRLVIRAGNKVELKSLNGRSRSKKFSGTDLEKQVGKFLRGTLKNLGK